MTNFQKAVEAVVDTMVAKYDTCIDPFYNAVDFAQVHFMEAGVGEMPCIHALMREFHAELTNRLGYPPCICHNSPTDDVVHVIGDVTSASPYYSDECCKRDAIIIAHHIIDDDCPGYRDEYRAMAFAAETIGERTGKTMGRVLENLNWDKEVLPQLMFQLINL